MLVYRFRFRLHEQPCGSKLQKLSSFSNYPTTIPLSGQNFGRTDQKWRLEQGLYQVDLAKRIGVNEMSVGSKGGVSQRRRTLNRYENS
jgi:hypothetical protein